MKEQPAGPGRESQESISAIAGNSHLTALKGRTLHFAGYCDMGGAVLGCYVDAVDLERLEQSSGMALA